MFERGLGLLWHLLLLSLQIKYVPDDQGLKVRENRVWEDTNKNQVLHSDNWC